MALQVFYSDRARDTARQVYNFILVKFGKKAAGDFKIKLENTIQSISEFPYIFKASGLDETIRIGLITRQTSVVYEVRDDTIYLHYFWDNRQEPMIS